MSSSWLGSFCVSESALSNKPRFMVSTLVSEYLFCICTCLPVEVGLTCGRLSAAYIQKDHTYNNWY